MASVTAVSVSDAACWLQHLVLLATTYTSKMRTELHSSLKQSHQGVPVGLDLGHMLDF